MDPQTLLQCLMNLGYRLEIRDDKIRVTPPQQGSDPSLIEALRQHKAEVIALLETRRRNASEQHQTEGAYFPLTVMQHAYLLGRSAGSEANNIASHAYHEIDVTHVDMERLEVALQQLVRRHPALRTQITTGGTQRVLTWEELNWPGIRYHDLRRSQNTNHALAAIRDAMSHQVIPLDRGLWIDVAWADLPDGYKILFVSHDGFAVDGISMQLLFRDWYAIYDGQNLPAIADGVEYRQCVSVMQDVLSGPNYHRAKAWWLPRIEAGLPPFPQIPLAQDPGSVGMRRWTRHVSTVAAPNTQLLTEMAVANGVSLNVVVLSAWAEVLALWGAGQSFTLNLTVADRPPFHDDVQHLVGNFTTNILLVIDRQGQESFLGRTRRIQQQLHQDLEHREFSGLDIMRELARRGRVASMPFTFNSTLGHAVSGVDGAYPFGPGIYSISQTPQVWFNVFVMQKAGELVIQLDVVDALFPTGMVADMASALEDLLQRLAVSPTTWEADQVCFVPRHQQTRRAAVNDTAAAVPSITLYEAFLASAHTYPKNIAVRSSARALTYEELVGLSAEVEASLARYNVKPGQLVAVIMAKGWEQIVAILGIIRSGAAYLPIDPDAPAARIVWLLENANVKQILTTQAVVAQGGLWAHSGCQTLCVDLLSSDTAVPAWETRNDPSDLAYVIYTSGSTGNPKGVMVGHDSVTNLITDINRRYGVTSRDVLFGISSYTFDLSVYDIFGALSAGATLVLPDADKQVDPSHWLALARKHEVTIWNSVPAIARMLVDEAVGEGGLPERLRIIMMSGDRIPVALPVAIRAQHAAVEIHSLGGPTETTVWNICFPISNISAAWPRIPYGKPNANNRYYILDEQLRPCPDWVPGGLYAAGRGLAKGYWKDLERTAEQFFYHNLLGERLYRTGDTGCFLPDGNIDIMGRDDFQVKLNGYRIEVGEIETLVTRHAGVKECATILVQDGPTQALVAFIAVQPQTELSLPELRVSLEAQLPSWMVPRHFIVMERLPLTSNAKVNRKALAELKLSTLLKNASASAANVDEVLDRNLIARLGALWQRLLPAAGADLEQDFFMIGGDSIMAARLASAWRKEFGISIPLGQLLKLRTMRAQLLHIQNHLAKNPTTCHRQLEYPSVLNDETEG